MPPTRPEAAHFIEEDRNPQVGVVSLSTDLPVPMIWARYSQDPAKVHWLRCDGIERRFYTDSSRIKSLWYVYGTRAPSLDIPPLRLMDLQENHTFVAWHRI